ncbi:hypothetical protein [Vibrio genomosp. F10]|uniref:hypothetical protein n=1 Tax=Vibrio genomosp. F10 TaxID=723171 RepID=UPI00037EFDBB|nr:hypothetical protein [Vibrio genomosp. F10]OEE84534.1 hypothetical protein A1QK_20205 [Vibrio genomosp. F10 str. 9ZD137]
MYRASTINSFKENISSIKLLLLSICLVGLWGYQGDLGFSWHTMAVIRLTIFVVAIMAVIMVISHIVGLVTALFFDKNKSMVKSLKYISRFFTVIFFIFGLGAFLDTFGIYPFLDVIGF